MASVCAALLTVSLCVLQVMLMASPPLQDLYHKSCGLAEDTSDQRESFQHPTRLVQFLVSLVLKQFPAFALAFCSLPFVRRIPGELSRARLKMAGVVGRSRTSELSTEFSCHYRNGNRARLSLVQLVERSSSLLVGSRGKVTLGLSKR